MTIVDLHSHYLPAAILNRWRESPVTVRPAPGGQLTVSALGQDYTVSGALCDVERQVADATQRGIDQRCLMIPPFAALWELPAPAGAQWARRVNEAIAATVAAHPDHLIGFATVALQDPDGAVRELEYAAGQLGLAGVQILTSLLGRGLDIAQLRPFWAAVAELGLTVFMHPHDVGGASRMTGQHLRNLVGNPLETALATARLLFSGILQDHPELKVVLAHGGGAAPWLIGRLAHGYRVRPEFVDGAADPADGVRRLYYDTVVFDPTVLRQLGELVGFDRLVLGSDYPFDMAEDDPVGFVRSSGLGEERVAAILRGAEHLVKQ